MPKRVHNALTAQSVKHAKAGRYADGGGLYLLVKESGARSWVYRYMLNGRSRDLGLGTAGHGGISLADARDHAAALRLKVKAGLDPLEERKKHAEEAKAAAKAQVAACMTFETVARSYIAANEEAWRNHKHRQQWKSTMSTYVYPVIGHMPVGKVDTSHVLQILEPIWKQKAETASRIRGRIETVLDNAKARGYRKGENPARWRGHLAQILPARTKLSRGHHKALPFPKIPDFVRQLQGRDAVAALALEFTILTAARTSEVTGAQWDEVDLVENVWTVPAERMKAGREHRVPLTMRAVEILQSLKPLNSKWIFPGTTGGNLSGMAMAMLIRRMGVDATVHGFRSAFRDWAAERTSYSHEVAEMALAHTIANKVERAYRRGDLFEKRAMLMADWEAFCSGRKALAATERLTGPAEA